jgi:hypothetical protein
MRLPNGEQAVVDLAKLRRYCLDPDHLRGRHKARVFSSALGFSRENADELKSLLVRTAARDEATRIGGDSYGQYFAIDLSIGSRKGTATVRSYWIIRHEEDIPRLVTCFVL